MNILVLIMIKGVLLSTVVTLLIANIHVAKEHVRVGRTVKNLLSSLFTYNTSFSLSFGGSGL